MRTELVVTVPAWVAEVVAAAGEAFVDDSAKMALAIELARQNVTRGGGPFGAAVFAGEHCVAVGVNRVLDTGFSIAHAEIVAIMAAQDALRSATEQPALALFTSAEPCCQCFGAIVWSGISQLVCGATTEDVEAIGFDEGPKPLAWQQSLRARGIEVVEQLQRTAASAVLREYQERGGVIYGLRSPQSK